MRGVLSTIGSEPVHVDGARCWYLIIMTEKNQHFRVRFGVGGGGH